MREALMRDFIPWIVVVLGSFAILVAACGSDQPPQPRQESPTDSNSSRIDVMDVYLQDGTKIECVVYKYFEAGGITCDWPSIQPRRAGG